MNRMRTGLTKLMAALWLVCAADTVLASDSSTAELVWAGAHGGSFALFYSDLQAERWSEPITLYQSDNSLTSPAMGTDAAGAKLLIWTEQLQRKTVLKSLRRTVDGRWREPSVFSDRGLENFSASIVYDLNDHAWVFWSSASGQLADIYLTRSTGGSWSKRQRIHAENEVPDILPVAGINAQGNVVVEWTRYSFEQRAYIPANREFEVEITGITNKNKQLSDSFDTEAKIKLPEFLPENTRFLLHFPANTMIQSRHLSRN